LDNISKISSNIDNLSKRINDARKEKTENVRNLEHRKANIGWRMVTELVVGMFIGFSLGFTIDKFLNLTPIFTIILSLLGFAAGIKTMIKTSKEFEKLNK
tara:strand:+ start:248 stop:547 length:300 start_codon:yes stop_codon:yes gene_type:complete